MAEPESFRRLPYRPCVVFDFDGCLHRYSQGWQDGQIYDPVDVAGLQLAMARGYAVAVVTCRSVRQVATALRARDFNCFEDTRCEVSFWRHDSVVLVTNRKVAAVAYLDDRAVYHIYGMPWGKTLDRAGELAGLTDGWHPNAPQPFPDLPRPGG